MELTYDEIVSSTGAELRQGSSPGPVRSVSTDSRSVGAGQCFVALKGAAFDAHDFVGQAVERGASALIVERAFPQFAEVTQFVVRDTLRALGAMANAWRMKFPELAVAAIVGSSGKTTTKEMAAEIVGGSRRTLSTRGNLNNLIGLPHTLFQLGPEHEAAVLELGMNMPDEARRLVEIASPGLVALTNIRDAHVGMFGTMEALYHGETESLRYAPEGSEFLMNADDPLSVRAREECAIGHKVLLFSTDPEKGRRGEVDFWATDIETLAPYGYRFLLREKGNDQAGKVELKIFGRHNVANAVTAAAICRWFGLGMAEIAERLCAFRPRLNRSEVEEVHGWWVLKDFYNAIPSAVKSALVSLADFEVPGRKFAVLADMAELGDFEHRAHVEVGEAAARAGLDHLFLTGERARIIHEAAVANGASAEHLPTLQALAERLAEELQPGDLLLIKGSRSMQLERLYSLLTGQEADAH